MFARLARPTRTWILPRTTTTTFRAFTSTPTMSAIPSIPIPADFVSSQGTACDHSCWPLRSHSARQLEVEFDDQISVTAQPLTVCASHPQNADLYKSLAESDPEIQALIDREVSFPRIPEHATNSQTRLGPSHCPVMTYPILHLLLGTLHSQI